MTTDPVNLYNTLKNALVRCPADLGGGSYLPQAELNRYIREPHVTACCKEELGPEHWHLAKSIITSAPRLFAILLLADKIERVPAVLECGLRDRHLPLVLGEDEITLVSHDGTVFRPFGESWSGWASRGVNEILKKQSAVNAPLLDDSGKHRVFDAKRVLPFMSKLNPLGSGGKDVFDCTILPGYFRAVGESDGDVATDGSGRRVAIKKFTKKADFDREMEALEATRREKHPGLIRFLSTFEKSNTYYILLPWADGSTLNSFWVNHGPRRSPRDRALIRKTLKRLRHLTDALSCFHSLRFRHGDLKPDNILHFTESAGQVDNFVIADLGIARHHRLDTNLRISPTLTKSTTATYEAPEARSALDGRQPLGRGYDIWSMGCIMLEYIVWLVWDVEAINAFAEKRDHPAYAFYAVQGEPDSTGLRPSIVHPAVLACMEALRADLRCQRDTALGDLVNLIENHMLLIEVDERYEAEKLHKAVEKIVRKANALGQGLGDEYVLPWGAEAPATRPDIFQTKATQFKPGAPK